MGAPLEVLSGAPLGVVQGSCRGHVKGPIGGLSGVLFGVPFGVPLKRAYSEAHCKPLGVSICGYKFRFESGRVQ